MNAQSRRLAHSIACGVLSLGLIAGSPMFVARAQAQTTLVDPNAPKDGMPPHAAAMAASARGDYIAALDFAKKAAAAGQPLDAEQVDYISGKAAKQQAALPEM